jgi:hypothetical protein
LGIEATPGPEHNRFDIQRIFLVPADHSTFPDILAPEEGGRM